MYVPVGYFAAGYFPVGYLPDEITELPTTITAMPSPRRTLIVTETGLRPVAGDTGFRNSAGGWYIHKDPGAVLDYRLDWDTWRGGDPAVSLTWSATTGITQAADGDTVTVSGGTDGAAYTFTCRITTDGGRSDERSFRVVVRER